MRKSIISLLIVLSAAYSFGQGSSKTSADYPDLGLHGAVTWLSESKIRVEYDWTDDAQLQDWIPTHGSNIIRNSGTVLIKGGNTSVRSMVWKQLVKCTRIYTQDAAAINSSRAHLNFVTNVIGWDGYNFNPPEVIGIIYVADGNYWLENGNASTLSSPSIALGQNYNTDINISASDITTKSSSDNSTYSRILNSPPDFNRQVAIGGWGGDTRWGKVTIEGELDPQTIAWQPPPGMINIRTCGSGFSPVIQVTGNPTIEWIFDDGTTSSSNSPVKDYGSIGLRNNLLRVTPWSALIGINLGYDAADGGYGGFAIVPGQNIFGFQNLSLAGSSLQYLCANYSPIYDLDLQDFTAIKHVELLLCHNLSVLKLSSHPVLERLCIEECNLDNLDISGCPGLKDLRGADNRYTFINWGTIGSSIWHICFRTNPQFVSNIPDLTRFPMLRELLLWDGNQTGEFSCHSNVIDRIDLYDNHYVSADLTGCSNLTQLSLSDSKLNSINLGTADNMLNVRLKDCWLISTMTDYVLTTLDKAGKTGGYLDLSGNAPPSSEGLTSRDNLVSKGWTVIITDPEQNIQVSVINVTSLNGKNVIDSPAGTLQLEATALPLYATNTDVTWSVKDGTGIADINSEGLVTALKNGTVTVIATASDGSGISGEFKIIISGQSSGESDLIVPIVTGNELILYLNSGYLSWMANLYNLNGKLISNKLIDSDIVRFDVNAMPPGIVIIVLKKGNNLRVAKAFIP